ncbi:MAG: PH domain-containing protein [Pseudomonadota bacterium]|mgnify:CR=1 FL=1
MLYVQQSLAPDENIVYVAKFHWFYDVQAVMCILWGVFLAISIIVSFEVVIEYLPLRYANKLLSVPLEYGDTSFTIVRKLHPIIKLFSLFVFLMGVMKFAHLIVTKVTTEIVVTTNRLIYKRGLIARSVGEMSIDRIESISVIQSFWGRVFDFGRLIIHGMGVGEIVMPNLAEPINFRKAIERARVS